MRRQRAARYGERKVRVWRAIAALLVLVPLLSGGAWLFRGDGEDGPAAPETPVARRPPAEPAEGACDLPPQIVQRVWRGFTPDRSGDVIMPERATSQLGGTRHSTPHGYTQNVPIVLYGPGFVRQGVELGRPATVADLAPTFAELLGFDEFAQGLDGRVLDDALLPEAERNGVPKLIFTLVWDGGGDNVLARWPESWPNLRSLLSRATSYRNGTVGSSPSITPAVHATIGTGLFPNRHGVPDLQVRIGEDVIDPWEGNSPQYLEEPTLADEWDLLNDNRPLVGLMAHDAWHAGMIGHGAFLEGADRDIMVLDNKEGEVAFESNDDFYELPDYTSDTSSLEEAVREVDLRDGALDGRWLDNPIDATDSQVRDTPAWPIYQTGHLVQILEREGFGADEVPDLFYTNYKTIDLAGHAWNMEEPEVRDALEETDRQLPLLIEALDRLVGPDSYVLALTADHGMTPYPSVRGAWSVRINDMVEDLEREFDQVTPDVPLVQEHRGYGLILDHDELEANGLTAEHVAAYVRDYTIQDNVGEGQPVPAEFRGREEEPIYLFALTPPQLQRAHECIEGKR